MPNTGAKISNFQIILKLKGKSMSVLVGHKAPDFTVAAVLGNGEIVGEFNLAKANERKK